MQMVTNDDVDNTENEYPAMNEIFTRRPVSGKKIIENKFYLFFFF
jgi:hypothetical protein